MKILRLVCLLVLMAPVGVVIAKEGVSPAQAAAALSEEQIRSSTDFQALTRLAAIYQQTGERERMIWAVGRLAELEPGNGELKLALAALHASQDNKSGTYDLLLAMHKQGFGYDLEGDPRFTKVADTRVWEYIVKNLQMNMQLFGEGRPAFSLPDGDHLYESIAWDGKREMFLVGSARAGSVELVDDSGKASPFISADVDNGLWSVYALAVDAPRDLLYVASTASVYFKDLRPADVGKAGIFKFRLSDGAYLGHWLVQGEGAHTLSSIVVGAQGQVFAADGIRNRIYRLEAGGLKVVMDNPLLGSLRGLALSPDGNRLYFADYRKGLFGIDLAAGRGFELAYDPASLVLGGIDGLYAYGDALVTIANGMSPKRVMRLMLDDSGRGIVNVMPLDAGHPAFKLMTTGTIRDDGLYFISNSQRSKYDQSGKPGAQAELAPVEIFRSDLRFAWDESGISTGLTPIPQATAEQAGSLLEETGKAADPDG